MTDISLATVTVDRKELTDALEFIGRMVDATPSDRMLLRLENGQLSLECSGVARLVDAKGTWMGTVGVPALSLLKLRSDLPGDEDRIRFEVKDEKLWIESLKLPCQWESIDEQPISIGLNASLRQIAALPYAYSENLIRASGLDGKVSEAKKEMRHLIGQAAEVLKPLGVGRKDVRKLVEKAIQPVAEEMKKQRD